MGAKSGPWNAGERFEEGGGGCFGWKSTLYSEAPPFRFIFGKSSFCFALPPPSPLDPWLARARDGLNYYPSPFQIRKGNPKSDSSSSSLEQDPPNASVHHAKRVWRIPPNYHMGRFSPFLRPLKN